MNFINRGFVNLALLPRGLYTKLGVNPVHLKAILSTKLLMDDRKPPPLAQVRRKPSAKPVNWATLSTMLFSAFLGLFYLLLFGISEHLATQLTFYFTVFFVMLSLTLISDFTSVLIDVRDNFIILPKPVNDRTVVVARLLHVAIHLCKIVLPMGLPALVYMGIEHGLWGAVLFLALLMLLTAFAIFFINAVYLLILKLTTPQRFQSIIGTVQIVFAVVMYGGYQLFPRMLSWMDFGRFNIETVRGIALYPLFWMAKTWTVLYSIEGTTGDVALAVVGLLFPLLCMYAVVRYLAPAFNRKLSLITGASEGPRSSASATQVARKQKRSISGFWGRLLTGGRAERAGFDLTWKMTARSRDFKLKVYPSMGYLLVYVAVVVLNTRRVRFTELDTDSLQFRGMLISALYFTSFFLMMAIGQMAYSEKFKAAWRYYVSPLSAPGEVIAGATKAVIVKFYLPMVTLVTAGALAVGGLETLPNVVLAGFNQVLISALRVYIGHKYFPFALLQSNAAKTGSFLRGLLVLLISGIIALGHFLLYPFTAVIIICAVLSVIATWLLFDALKNISWGKILNDPAGAEA